MHRGYSKSALDLLQRDFRFGVHMFGGEVFLIKYERQWHGEAAGVGHTDEFFRFRAGLALEAAGTTIGVFGQRPLSVEIAPLPSLMPPCYSTDPNVFIRLSPDVSQMKYSLMELSFAKVTWYPK
jgi:hypothetical protein